MYIYGNTSLNYFYFWQKLQRKIKTHFLCPKLFFFFRKSCPLRDSMEMWGKAGQATYHNIITRIRFAFWITKATDIHSEYIIFTAFLQQQWLRERALMLHYTYIACLVITQAQLYSVHKRKLSGHFRSVSTRYWIIWRLSSWRRKHFLDVGLLLHVGQLKCW